jgi:hypothetical protein
MLRFPDQKCTIILLANLGSINPSGLCFEIADILLADQLKEEPKEAKKDMKSAAPVTTSPEQLNKYTGHFEHSESGIAIQIDLENGDLYLKVMGQKYLLRPLKKNLLKADAPIGITVDYSSLVTDKTVIFDVENQGQFKMRPIHIEEVSPEQLTEYAGEYYSERLMTTYTFDIIDRMLHLKLPNQARNFPMIAKTRDSFSASPELSGASMDFQRNAKGEIKGFLVRIPLNRVKTIYFAKK